MKKLLFFVLMPLFGRSQNKEALAIRQYMQEQAGINGFTGSVLIVKNNNTLLKAGYGPADREWNIPNSAVAKYRIGSISKQFTAVCVLQLAEKGRLSLQDRLSKFLPDFPKGDSVTIHMLLNHTSGIHDYTSKPEFIHLLKQHWGRDSILSFFRNDPYDFSPGERFRYSNSNYFLLGYIVEKVSGQSFGNYLRLQVLDKLGMKNTGIDQYDSVLTRRARGYQVTDGITMNCDMINMDWNFGCGQVYSTIDDLYAWTKAYDGTAVLSELMRNKMFTPGLENYGYGIAIDSFNHHKRYSHSGDVPGFDSYLCRFTDDGTYLIILSNNQFNVKRMAAEISHLLYDDPHYIAAQKIIFAKQFKDATNEQDKKRAQWQLDNLKAMHTAQIQDSISLLPYTGVFGRGMEFFVRGHYLFCKNPDRGNEIFKLKHIEGNHYVLDDNVQIEFDKNTAGKMQGLRMLWINGNTSYQPTKEIYDHQIAEWQRKYQLGIHSVASVDTSFILPFIGTYRGGLQFYLEGHDLYCKNAERGNSTFPIHHIEGNLFVLDENVLIEFMKTGQGPVSGLTMHWQRGGEDFRAKEK